MEIYLDCNATTPVLPQARAAAQSVMADDFGNPSSIHSTGLKARAVMTETRSRARRLLGATTGELLFVSGATEGIQTAVISALASLQEKNNRQPAARAELLLYGATEHKAVPEALKHWNHLLGLNLQIQAIPVDTTGRHDLAWLRQHAPRAGLVCTMAANNETGVVSDLDGIEAALEGSETLWLVDGVQALGKMPLDLSARRIDYAPFSGHKLYAPKGIGLLYVRKGAPFTPLMAGGGQENALRSGTENMAGIAALGAVLAGLDDGQTFRPPAAMAEFRDRLADALRESFAGLVFNAPLHLSLPTTLNFSVPGLASRLLLDLFDAAGVRVSGGSACSASKALPSHVLEAMGLPAWQAASAVRLSFGPAVDSAFIDEACDRIRACGVSLRASCLNAAEPGQQLPADGLTRLDSAGSACCYLLADAASRRCVVIDPVPALADRIAGWVSCQGYTLAASLHTGSGEGWPAGAGRITLGKRHLVRAGLAGAAVYLLLQDERLRSAFMGESEPAALEDIVAPQTLLLPGRDGGERFATTLSAEQTPAAQFAGEPTVSDVQALLASHPELRLVDVREPYEQRMGAAPSLGGEPWGAQAVALSGLADALPDWLLLPAGTPLLFFCRSGNRSAQAARLLRRLGHARSFSLAGGLALWPGLPAQPLA
jgi:cysteine desulfurase